MQHLEIIQIKQQIINKIVNGDYITLGKMLDKAPATARRRFERNKEDAVLGMQLIIQQREDLIKSYKIED